MKDCKNMYISIEKNIHFLCFISNAVLDRPVDNSQNFDGVAYIAQEILHLCCLALEFWPLSLLILSHKYDSAMPKLSIWLHKRPDYNNIREKNYSLQILQVCKTFQQFLLTHRLLRDRVLNDFLLLSKFLGVAYRLWR